MYVRLSDDGFRKPRRRKFIFAHPILVKFVYEGHRVKVKVIGAKKGLKCVFPQCKTLIINNSVSIKHRSAKFACSMEFSDMADRMMWSPSLSRDRK